MNLWKDRMAPRRKGRLPRCRRGRRIDARSPWRGRRWNPGWTCDWQAPCGSEWGPCCCPRRCPLTLGSQTGTWLASQGHFKHTNITYSENIMLFLATTMCFQIIWAFTYLLIQKGKKEIQYVWGFEITEKRLTYIVGFLLAELNGAGKVVELCPPKSVSQPALKPPPCWLRVGPKPN